MTPPEPPIRCVQHLEDASPGPCRACGDAREYHKEWDRDRRATVAEEASTKARKRAELRRLDVEQCHMCDDAGYYKGLPCSHDPLAASRATAGLAAVRAALAEARHA
jgi:hypothetical protein